MTGKSGGKIPYPKLPQCIHTYILWNKCNQESGRPIKRLLKSLKEIGEDSHHGPRLGEKNCKNGSYQKQTRDSIYFPNFSKSSFTETGKKNSKTQMRAQKDLRPNTILNSNK